jgi:hypothetical protein
MSPAYEGGVVHHTAFFSSYASPFPARGTLIGGRPDLPGPLCNVAGPVCDEDTPTLHVIAAYPANHAGASGGRSMGPLPRTSLFNKMVVGLEIDYRGIAPMIGGQYRAALIFARGLANVLKRSVEYIRAHAETSITGKWDIGYAEGRTYDMAKFRRDAAALAPQTTEDPVMAALTKQDEAQIQQYGGLVEACAIRAASHIATAANPWGLDSLRRKLDNLGSAVAEADANDSPELLAKAVVAALPEKGSAPGGGLTKADVEATMRSVLGSLDGA